MPAASTAAATATSRLRPPLSGIWPTGGYVFALTGEDSSGYSESMVGSIQYTAGSSSSAGTITGVMDMVDYQTLSPDVT